LLPSERKFYLCNAASALANYKKLLEAGETSAQTITVTITGNDQNIRSAVGDVGWITDAGVPNVTSLKSGEYKVHIYAKQTTLTGKKNIYLYAKLWNVDADGTSNLNLLGTSTLTHILTETMTDYNVDIHLATPVTIDATDRLRLHIYASLSGSGANPELVFGYADLQTTDPYQAFPINSAELQDLITKKHTRNTDTTIDGCHKHSTMDGSSTDAFPTDKAVGDYVPFSAANNGYGFFYTTSVTTIGTAGTYVNIPITTADANNLNTSINGNRVKISKAGRYSISYSIQFTRAAGETQGGMRLGLNSDNAGEIAGSQVFGQTSTADRSGRISHTIEYTFAANDEISIQMTGSDTNLTKLGFWSGTSWGTTKPTATIEIHRVG
jgi:hypothetical protein